MRSRLLRRIASVSLVVALGNRRGTAQETYRRADIDSSGGLRLTLSTNRVIRPRRDSAQIAFAQVAVSADRRIAGAVALYPNCCTTYPIPLTLILFRADGSRSVIRSALPIWQWAFAPDGRSVVLREAPVHGTAPASFERRDLRSGRLLATAQADAATVLPAWVRVATPRSP